MLTANARTADIHHLLECVKANDPNHAIYTDEIILAAVKELAKTPNNEVGLLAQWNGYFIMEDSIVLLLT